MKTDRRSHLSEAPFVQGSHDRNVLRSPIASASEAALKGLGESPSQAEKAMNYLNQASIYCETKFFLQGSI
jgi:hypothetical protein